MSSMGQGQHFRNPELPLPPPCLILHSKRWWPPSKQLRYYEDRVSVLLVFVSPVVDWDLMLTLPRTVTEMAVTLELEGVHKAGPSLMGHHLIHSIIHSP